MNRVVVNLFYICQSLMVFVTPHPKDVLSVLIPTTEGVDTQIYLFVC